MRSLRFRIFDEKLKQIKCFVLVSNLAHSPILRLSYVNQIDSFLVIHHRFTVFLLLILNSPSKFILFSNQKDAEFRSQ